MGMIINLNLETEHLYLSANRNLSYRILDCGH